jgi:LPS-assembly protein
MRFRLNPVAFSLLCAFAPLACAGENDEPTLKLDRTFMVAPKNRPGEIQEETPIFLSAQRMEGKKDNQVEAIGEAELHKRGETIYADHMLYLQDRKDVFADGAVRIEQNNNVIEGPHLKLNLDTNIGDMPQPVFQLGDNHAHGNAENLHLAGKQEYVLHDVVYTTCPVDQDDWILKVRELEIDRNSQMGVAHSALVEFMGVPILYTPWMDFPLDDQRKSGFLAPTYGSTVSGGSDLTLPYYWNIAPNLDATLSPRIIAKRGIMLNNEMRYLGPGYSGIAELDVLPGDRLSGTSRSLLALNHKENFGSGLTGSVDFTHVSDYAYFTDLSTVVSATSQTNLLQKGTLNYTGGWWNVTTQMQRYQTLQDPAAPVLPPYSTLPQVTLGAQQKLGDANATFAGSYTDFIHPTLVNGQRLVLYPSVSYPLVAQPAYYLTPKLGLHNTFYLMGSNNTTDLPNVSRTLPIFSLDSGVTMERDWSMAGKDFVQTLEPRAYYVYIPYHDQHQLPVFDTALAALSFTQMFTENRFSGSDRIGDTNQATLVLTSRLLEPDSGAEQLRVAIGEQFSAITPQVNLVTPTTTTNTSDILLAASGKMARAWTFDSALQFTPSQSQLQQFNASARYQPESGKVFNLGYRFTRNSLRQMDLSTQWPLFGHWNAVARWNYSIQDGRILEALGGLEYNKGCWALRMVAQRFATATLQVTTGIFVQLELKDLVTVGADPLSVLRQSIAGYTKTNDAPINKPVQGLQ